jgi:hypothetical protein
MRVCVAVVGRLRVRFLAYLQTKMPQIFPASLPTAAAATARIALANRDDARVDR